jgi:hypothetical protein
MQRVIHLDDRGGGAATIFFDNHGWKRVPSDDSPDAAHWFRLQYTPEDPLEAADSETRRILEHAYRRPETTEPVRRHPRIELPLKLDQLVFCSALGFGRVVAIDGDDITVGFGEKERQMGKQDLVTRVGAEVAWHTYWLRGEKRRLEEGKRLFIVKSLCEFGEWQAFLDLYDYPRSSADDLIRRYKNEVIWETQIQQLPGNRASDLADPDRQDNERKADPEAEKRADLVRAETEKRRDRMPTYHTTLWTIRIKLPPDILIRCREKYKLPGAKKYWRRAAYEFVGEDPSRKVDMVRHQMLAKTAERGRKRFNSCTS